MKSSNEDGSGDAHGGALDRLGGDFLGPAFVDAPRPGVGANQVVLKHSLKIRLLADFFEEGESHAGVMYWDFARPQDGAARAGCVRGAKARREKAPRAARALKIGDSGPAFAHQINQGRVKWIRGADAVPQFDAFLFRLLLLSGRRCVGAAHPGNVCLKGGGGGRAVGFVGHLREQATLDDTEYFVAFDRFTALVLARDHVIERSWKVEVMERLTLA